MPAADHETRFRIAVKQFLREGFGVEDIALKTGRTSARVRLEVEALRKAGWLDRVFKEEGQSDG
jgi:hypothetical protein